MQSGVEILSQSIDMQMNVGVDLPVAVVHGVAFNLFACPVNFCGS